MPVTNSDIHFLKSSAGASEGGAASGTEIVPATLDNLFRNFTDAERVSGAEQIKAWFLQNESESDSLVLPSMYISTQPSGDTEYLGVHMDAADASDPAQGNLVAWDATRLVGLKSSGTDTRVCTVIGLAGDGTPTEEQVTLSGTSYVYSATAYSVVYAVQAASTSGVTISIFEANVSGLVTDAVAQLRGTIGTSKVESWLWVATSSKANGIRRADLVPAAKHGYWDKIVLPPDSSGVRPNSSIVTVEENG